jgi:siroheme synthase
LLKSAGTLVELMGVQRIAEIAKQLVDNGVEAGTPLAVIEQGTRDAQTTRVTTLLRAAEDCSDARAPGIVVIGEVVRLRPSLRWFDDASSRSAEDRQELPATSSCR